MYRRSVYLGLALVYVAFISTTFADEPAKAKLPLKRVVLFSSGVGFFEHAGQVQNDAKVEMKFKPNDINDLLKSMVVQDLDGGQVSTVTYGSKDPVTKTLKSFSIDLTTQPTLAQLLRQVRGERVVVEADKELSGVILGVETRKQKIGKDEVVETSVLNLLTDQGLRAVSLDSVVRIKLANEQLDAELRKALAVLASSHGTDKKSVDLNFLGKGTRRVRVGYIQETPVWKTTYRLVLSDGKPLLQGWAIVENTSEEDWSGVNLTLVSGRPISFTMDLYQPLYIPRPEEQLELYSSLRPQVYGQDMYAKDAEFATKRKEPLSRERKLARPALAESAGFGMGGGMGGMAPAAPAKEPGWNPGQGVQSAAQAGNVGNLFQYAIATPVSLPRQQSAMLPIVNADVKGEKVSIYNAGVQAKHPLYGLRFTNTTDLHLMQGPITVFDGGVYAGDAKIEDLPPGSQRLISYGMDLDTEVVAQSRNRPEELLSVRILKGALIATRKYVRATEYTVKNSGKKEKTVLIEQPFDADWKLIAPKEPSEKTRNLYRFAVEAKPGEPAKLDVYEQRTEGQSVALTNMDDQAIGLFIRSKVVGDKVKAALAEVVKRKHALQQVVAQRERLEQRIGEIGQDQTRIRQNMAQLDRTADVYKNYVKEFSDQESEIKKLRGQIKGLKDQEVGQRTALDEYLIGLDL
jgi:hypothetical protein